MAIGGAGRSEVAPWGGGGGVLFWERLHRFAHNNNKGPVEVVYVPTIFMKDPHKSFKRERLGSPADLREGRRERSLA